MRFTYTLYEPSMAPELDGFLDEAAYYTGCENDGIEEYVQYWCAQPEYGFLVLSDCGGESNDRRDCGVPSAVPGK